MPTDPPSPDPDAPPAAPSSTPSSSPATAEPPAPGAPPTGAPPPDGSATVASSPATSGPAQAAPKKKSSRGGIIALLVIVLAAFAMCTPLCFIGGTPSVGGDTVLEIDLEQPLDETAGAGPIPFLPGGTGKTLLDVERALDKAKSDPHVKGLVARVGSGNSLATVQELRESVLAFRAAGKPAIAWSEGFGEMSPGLGAYDLATAFDEVWLQPSGDVGLGGVFSETMFLRGALDKLGVEPEMHGRKEYKNAVNQLTETTYTPAHREALGRMLQSYEEQIIDDIVAARPKLGDKAAVKALVESGPISAQEALDKGLVDKLGYKDEVMASLKARFGKDEERLWVRRYAERAGVSDEDKGAGPVVALIVAKGSVTRGQNGVDPLGGGESFGSDSMRAAIKAAADDDDVKVILLRVDSPGGSYVASDSIWRAIKQAQKKGKKVVASMGDLAASGGYFVSMAADRVVAERGTLTGSIGVFAGKMVTAQMWQKLGVNFEPLAASPDIDVSNYSNDVPYSEAAEQNLEHTLDRIYLDFTKKAADARKMDYDKLEALAHGRVWTGADAKERGLVDELGGFMAAVDAARELAGAPKGAAVRLRPFPKRRSTLEEILAQLRGAPGDNSDDLDTEAVVRPSPAVLRAARALVQAAHAESAGVLEAPPMEVRP